MSQILAFTDVRNKKIKGMGLRKSILIWVISLIVFTIGMNAYGQEKNDALEKYLQDLSIEQKQILKEQQDLIDNTKAVFRENLTKDQLAIIYNKNISIDQRTKLIKRSLTRNQLDIIRSNRMLLRSKRDLFRHSLSDKQKFRLRHFMQHRTIDDRSRLIRRLKRLIRDNMNSDI